MAFPSVIFGPPRKFDLNDSAEVVGSGDGAGPVTVPHGDFLLSAEYVRVGPHLSLSEGGTEVLIKDYFTFGTPPDLLSEDGSAVIEGSLAGRLAGPLSPGQFAQVGQLAQANTSPSIGVVEKLEGVVSLVRTDGTTVRADKGSQIFTGDIVKTESGANIGITFVDQTSFALGESGRMVIDEMIYSPGADSGKSSFSVVQGVFSFVSGAIAKTGADAMVVKTPVATIGIRGTTVSGKAAAEGSANSITLLPDADGGVGQIAVSNSAGTQIMSVPFQTTSLSSAFTAPLPPVVLPASQIQNLYGNIKSAVPPSRAPARQQNESNDNNAGPAAPEEAGEAAAEEGPEGEGAEGEAPPEGEGEGGCPEPAGVCCGDDSSLESVRWSAEQEQNGSRFGTATFYQQLHRFRDF